MLWSTYFLNNGDHIGSRCKEKINKQLKQLRQNVSVTFTVGHRNISTVHKLLKKHTHTHIYIASKVVQKIEQCWKVIHSSTVLEYNFVVLVLYLNHFLLLCTCNYPFYSITFV